MAIINKETIISAFDDKMTLLQWLKKLEKVLDTSTLASIKTIKVANTQYKIVLSFEDGTTIESDIIQLQSEIAGIQLDNGHLIFTLINGETLDAGLIDVSNLGNTTIYGTFEVADGDATFGANVEIDGALKVNSTLQVGDTTTNDDELAKLPRTLLTPLETPSEQKLVGIDTANGQNLLGLGEGLLIENNKMRVGGTIDAEVVESMEGFSVSLIQQSVVNLTDTYANMVKNGNKLTIVFFAKFNKVESPSTNLPTIARFTIPYNVGTKLYGHSISGYVDIINVSNSIAFASLSNTQNVSFMIQKQSNTTLDLLSFIQSLESGVDYQIRLEATFLLSDNMLNG